MMESLSSQTTVYECDLCDKIYRSKHSLQIHRTQQHVKQEDKVVFACSLCDKSYTSKSNFNRHVRSHSHEFVCEDCGHTTSTEKQLTIHTNGHKLGKVFCRVCYKFYKDNGVLVQHTAACHGIEKEEEKDEEFSFMEPSMLETSHEFSVSDSVHSQAQDHEVLQPQLPESPPSLDFEIPVAFLNICTSLRENDVVELTGSSLGSGNSDVKMLARKTNEAVLFSLAAEMLGMQLSKHLTTRWHCDISNCYVEEQSLTKDMAIERLDPQQEALAENTSAVETVPPSAAVAEPESAFKPLVIAPDLKFEDNMETSVTPPEDEDSGGNKGLLVDNEGLSAVPQKRGRGRPKKRTSSCIRGVPEDSAAQEVAEENIQETDDTELSPQKPATRSGSTVKGKGKSVIKKARPGTKARKPTPKKRRNTNRDSEGMKRFKTEEDSSLSFVRHLCSLSTVGLCKGPTNEPADKLYCVICQGVFGRERRSYFSSHLREIHRVSLSEYLEILETESDEEKQKKIEHRRGIELEERRLYKARKYATDKDNLLPCPSCPQLLIGIAAFRSHVTTVHIHDDNYEEIAQKAESMWYDTIGSKFSDRPCIPISCNICPVEKNGMLALKAHMRMSHVSEPNLRQKIKDRQELYKLLYKKYRREQYHKSLAEHKPTFSCEFCGEQFAFRSSMGRHVKHSCTQNPNRQKRHSCAVCTMRFESREEMVAHKEQHKLEGTKHICDICGLVRATRAGMYSHKKVHHNKNAPKYSCKFCNKTFYVKERLLIHESVHSDVRAHQCDICGKSYKTKGAVYKHQTAVHFNRYKYRCPDCGHGVQKPSYLKAHRCGRVRRSQASTATPHTMKTEKAEPKVEGETNLASEFLVTMETSTSAITIVPHEQVVASETVIIDQSQLGQSAAISAQPNTEVYSYNPSLGRMVPVTVLDFPHAPQHEEIVQYTVEHHS